MCSLDLPGTLLHNYFVHRNILASVSLLRCEKPFKYFCFFWGAVLKCVHVTRIFRFIEIKLHTVPLPASIKRSALRTSGVRP